jgi:integrase
MAVYDRWHLRYPGPRDEPCKCSRGKHKLYPSSDHLKGDRWQVRWTDPDGKARKANRPKKGGQQGESDPDVYAEAFDAKVRAELAAGTYTDPSAGVITLTEYAKQWRGGRTADRTTLTGIDSKLKVHIYDKPIGDQPMALLARRPSLVQQWVTGMKGLEPSTVKAIADLLSSIFVAAIDDGLVHRNPVRAKSVTLPTVVRKKVTPWTREQVEAAAAAMDARYRAMVFLCAGCGHRQGEALAIAEDDIDGMEVQVVRQIRRVDGELVFAPPKGGVLRTVPMSDTIWLRLAAHIAEFEPTPVTLPWLHPGSGKTATAKLLFTDERGRRIHRDEFNPGQWHPARAAAGVEASRANGMHVLRHTAASAWLSAGLDINTVAEFLGHADPAFTLRIYGHMMPGSSERARRAMDAFFTAAPEGSDRDANARNLPGEDGS